MALHGKLGNNVLDGTALVNLKTVSLSETSEVMDTGAMGDSWASKLAGLTDFTVSAEGNSKAGLNLIALLGSEGENEIVIQSATTDSSLTGAAILSAFTETAAVEDLITVSYTIEGNDSEGLSFADTGTDATGSAGALRGKHITAAYGTGPATTLTDIKGWTVTGSVALSDATVAHASERGRKKIAGLKTVSASVTMLTPLTAVLPAVGGAAAPLTIQRSGTAADGTYSGNAVCSGHEFGIDVNNVETVTMSFVYDGVVTLTVTVVE